VVLEDTSLKAIYLFCFARSAFLPEISGKGVDGENPLFLLPCRDIVAVAGMVALDEFYGDLAESRMGDLEWVGPRVCRHEQVVEKIMHHSPVLPARFGTIFLSLESLQNRMKMHGDAIRAFFDRVFDTEEWSVKGLLNRENAAQKQYRRMLAGQAEHLSSFPGTRYLEQQRLQAAAQNALNYRLKEVNEDVAHDLSRIAIDWAVRKTLPRKVTGGEAEMILNWAFLVPRNVTADLCARIDRANAECADFELVFELSGPWPPYSFCPILEAETRP